MEVLDQTIFVVDEDILNFTLDAEDSNPNASTVGGGGASSSSTTATTPFSQDTAVPFPEFEEDLEWLSNKDAFPEVETCFDVLNENPGFILNHESPVSVLENSSSSSSYNSSGSGSGSVIPSCFVSVQVPTSFPVRARSKRGRRTSGFGGLPIRQWPSSHVIAKTKQQPAVAVGVIGRRCLHCQTDKTPQWRGGPMGPKTLCNACGVRYKSGRLLPEYRPASSPTFSSRVHSNSHRKVVEMRKKKQQPPMGGEMVMNEACGYMAG